MYNKYLKNNGLQIILSLLAVLLFVYILLFEFILPINQLFPRPSTLIESVPSLFNEYKLLYSLMYTLSIIYMSMLGAYFIVKLSSKLLIKISVLFPEIKHLFDYLKYFLPILLIFLFKMWFGNSFWGEILFILIIISVPLRAVIINAANNVKQEYINSAKSLGINENKLISDVIWKIIQPELFSRIRNSHFLLWSYAIIYELICNTEGIGNIFRLSVKYNDISVIILLVIVVILFIALGEYLLGKIKTKYFFWDA